LKGDGDMRLVWLESERSSDGDGGRNFFDWVWKLSRKGQ
jgi:hypothetical protein